MPIGFDLKKFLNPVFIETGLWKGEGALAAIRAGFKIVYSIEIQQSSIDQTMNSGTRFGRHLAPHVKNGRVRIILGNSAEELPKLLDEMPDEQFTFWLDAHQGHPSFPLEKELIAISQHPRKDHTILIDDLRKFDDWGFDRNVIKQRLLEINPDYEFRLLPGLVPHDVLAAIPPQS
jgi:hypothetical protein